LTIKLAEKKRGKKEKIKYLCFNKTSKISEEKTIIKSEKRK
jgi:hypothetical protein